MRSPLETVQEFYAAIGREDFAAARALLSEPFSFVAWFDRMDQPDAYIDAVRKLRGFIVKIDVQKVFVDGGDVCLIYDAYTADGTSTPAAVWLQVREDTIAAVRVICDPRPVADLWGKPLR